MCQREMKEADTLLLEETKSFIGWRESISAIPIIDQLQEKANQVREE
jgi:glutamyl-tRNA reductase